MITGDHQHHHRRDPQGCFPGTCCAETPADLGGAGVAPINGWGSSLEIPNINALEKHKKHLETAMQNVYNQAVRACGTSKIMHWVHIIRSPKKQDIKDSMDDQRGQVDVNSDLFHQRVLSPGWPAREPCHEPFMVSHERPGS